MSHEMTSKGVRTMAFWCMSEQQLPQESLTSEVGPVVDSVTKHLAQTVDLSQRIPGQVQRQATKLLGKLVEQCPHELLNSVGKWLPSLLKASVSENNELYSEAYECLQHCVSQLKLNTLAEVHQCLIPFLGELSTAMMLLLSRSREVQATKVWGMTISLLGPKCLKAAIANPLFKIMEKTFVSKQSHARVASYVAWKILIDVWREYSNPELDARRMKIVMAPIVNSLSFKERARPVRDQAQKLWTEYFKPAHLSSDQEYKSYVKPIVDSVVNDIPPSEKYIGEVGWTFVAVVTYLSDLIEGQQHTDTREPYAFRIVSAYHPHLVLLACRMDSHLHLMHALDVSDLLDKAEEAVNRFWTLLLVEMQNEIRDARNTSTDGLKDSLRRLLTYFIDEGSAVSVDVERQRRFLGVVLGSMESRFLLDETLFNVKGPDEPSASVDTVGFDGRATLSAGAEWLSAAHWSCIGSW
eukprot:scaffold207_cov409-Prasinococcus_capsulatus_cf.AAC.116